ncbi:hypothetical protein [Paraburkholderia tuberum]|uniref:Uncharacterized protein n=1 Tax=Paraburkholderia tuberum TaxID=157910 RepID=A0A1H1JSA3_9BURK|nr:hypothetical protein [Paraburkholderia tuberum]SDR52782.1 hypothetical protein SAMN05445850_5543 [Paraburkholderia tuberum]
MNDRDWHIRMARTYLAEAARARHYGHWSWHATLLSWVAGRRRQAAAISRVPAQGELFSDAHPATACASAYGLCE